MLHALHHLLLRCLYVENELEYSSRNQVNLSAAETTKSDAKIKIPGLSAANSAEVGQYQRSVVEHEPALTRITKNL